MKEEPSSSVVFSNEINIFQRRPDAIRLDERRRQMTEAQFEAWQQGLSYDQCVIKGRPECVGSSHTIVSRKPFRKYISLNMVCARIYIFSLYVRLVTFRLSSIGRSVGRFNLAFFSGLIWAYVLDCIKVDARKKQNCTFSSTDRHSTFSLVSIVSIWSIKKCVEG